MSRWREILTAVMPWLDREADEQDGEKMETLRAHAEVIRREQEELAPHIDEQTRRLVKSGEVNGFTRQLAAGFHRRLAAGE